jgi:hypothetical protein
MKRLRMTRSVGVVRRKGARLAAVAAGLVALAAFTAVPADARHVPGADGSDGGHWSDGGGHRPPGDGSPPTAASLVNFRRDALFSCFGADGSGTPTANTANITAGLTTITALVTVHAPPGSAVSGQLTQSGCVKLKFFTFVIGATGSGTTTVTDLRVSNMAFVWFNDTAGDFQITPTVRF